jgi:hypothetical protein
MEGGCWIKVKAELEVQDLFLAEDDYRKSDMEDWEIACTSEGNIGL